jgi:YbbR domain-containing protein
LGCLSLRIQQPSRSGTVIAIVIEAVVRAARRNVRTDTSSKSATVRTEEAGRSTDASKTQIGNVASAKTDADIRGSSEIVKKLRSPVRLSGAF